MPRVRRSDAVPGSPGAGPSAAARTPGRRPVPLPSARVVVITAPAGSGKSRLVDDWLAQQSPAEWVRIDLGPSDRDTPLALDEAIAWLAVPERVRPRCVLTGLEQLGADEVGELVLGLTDRLPGRAQVVLLGSGSGLPASTLVRLGEDLAEVRAVDLWWTRADLSDQLARLTGIVATEPEAAQLFRLTAGWPAGVIILGRAMRSRPGVLAVADLTVVPEILDFLTAEVLDRLAAPVLRFVLHTCVLDELTVQDCAALLPTQIAHAMLTQVHRQGLTAELWPGIATVHPVPRYHPLIRAAALAKLRASDGAAERALLRTAAGVARRHGRETTAFDHLAAADDWDGVVAVLLGAAGNGFRGWQPLRLRAALELLPNQVWEPDLEHRALVAFAAAMSGDQLFAAQVLQQTPAELRDGAGWWPVLSRIIEAIPGHAGGSHGGYRAACSALASLQTLDRTTRIPAILGVVDRPSLIATAHLLAARAGVFDRDQISVRRHLEAGWSQAGAQPARYCVLAGLGADALTAAWGGQLAAAERRIGRAQRLATEAGLAEHPMLSLTLLARVELLRARGRSAQALAELDACAPALDRSEPFVAAASGGRVHTAAAQVLRAMLALDLADPDAARAELTRLNAAGDDDPPRNLAAGRAVAWARLHLHADDVTAAEQALAAAPDTGTVTAARIVAALQRQDPEQAQTILRSWPFEDTLDNRIRRLLSAAAVAVLTDRRAEAGDHVDQALVAAEPDGHVQIFLDAPPRARALVRAVLKRSLTASGWRAELADRLDEIRILSTEAGAIPVTPRERAVLEYLTTTLTHASIAAALFVSENTLKSHCRNLYRKLGVNTRGDAVRAARARGWIEPAVVVDLSPSGEVVLDPNITPVPVVVEL
jgi:LuxR family transcriptional regulator, maltose regulon positive regulatory protein